MVKESFFFVIDYSVALKINDLNYKFGVSSKFLSLLFFSMPLLKVRFLVLSLVNNPSLSITRALVGFCWQVYLVKVSDIRKTLVLKDEYEKVGLFSSKCSKFLNYFWFYSFDLNLHKSIIAGLLGKSFVYLRLFILDIFSFFGSEFFEEFYINYFNFSEIFIFDFFFNFSFSKKTKIKSFQYKNFLTFFKMVLIKFINVVLKYTVYY